MDRNPYKSPLSEMYHDRPRYSAMFHWLGSFMLWVGLIYVPVGILLLVAAAIDPAMALRMKLLSGSGNGMVGLMLIWLGRRIRNRHDPKRTRIDAVQKMA